MLERLNEIERQARQSLRAAGTAEALEAWHRQYLAKKGEVQLMSRQIGGLDPAERPLFGKRINEVKGALQAAFDERQAALKAAALEAELGANPIDVTLPGRRRWQGRLHPATQTLREIYRIWGDMGFQIYRSRDVETDEYNFGLLNIPEHHPARDMWDTFHTTDDGVLLRTHTSPGQIHAMREYCPEPIRVILPGMVFRYEQVTARRDMQFHQVEGLAVGTNITFADLKGTLAEFAYRMYGRDRRMRFRASYFPFTEPSAEMDIECNLCDGDGCPVCEYTGWLEILGSGMVHPTVLRNGGYDPDIYSGFAFGLGPERITMLKYGIDDIRYFWGNDLRFLEQF